IAGRAAGNEVGLGPVVLKHQTEEVPAQAEIYCQLGSDLPIVVDVAAVIIFSVVGERDIGDEHAVVAAAGRGAADVVNSIRDGRVMDVRQKQELRASGIAVSDIGNIGINAAVVKLSARPWWLESRELYMLPLKTHLEGVLAIDLGKVVSHLESRSDLVRRQECVAAES